MESGTIKSKMMSSKWSNEAQPIMSPTDNEMHQVVVNCYWRI